MYVLCRVLVMATKMLSLLLVRDELFNRRVAFVALQATVIAIAQPAHLAVLVVTRRTHRCWSGGARSSPRRRRGRGGTNSTKVQQKYLY